MTAAGAPTPEPATRPNEAWGPGHAIDVLRIGVGIVWLVNLLFIVNPANQYWTTFSSTARSFAPTTIGGPGLAEYVAAHPLFFSWTIALVTTYLAIALILGLTTRLACFVGSCFSAVLLATQFGTTFLFPGGTDVGAHPLYILVYAVLLVGGAGRWLSLDVWLRNALAARRRAHAVPSVLTPRPWAAAMPSRELVTLFVVGTLVSLGFGFGLVLAIPVPASNSTAAPPGPTSYVNLTVSINPLNGWPQYSPANFTIPAGTVVFTIVDNDSPMNWTACPCPVRGTVGGTELLNGTPMTSIPSANVAHTFNIPALGVQVLSPGQSTVQFSVAVSQPGEYIWYCFAPCGTGMDPYNSPPMDVAGYMTGTMTAT
ncbi:MAG: hypothetical protein L3K00_05735 [Thermoplasmata archaeon]|nr:hypothetical protein [Thermoplasmata archaeon]